MLRPAHPRTAAEPELHEPTGDQDQHQPLADEGRGQGPGNGICEQAQPAARRRPLEQRPTDTHPGLHSHRRDNSAGARPSSP